MKAAIATSYGPPEVIVFRDIEKPTPSEHEILVKIHASTITSADSRLRSFNVPPSFRLPARLILGIRRLRHPILGTDFAGEVEAVGSAVKRFKVGDRVFGTAFQAQNGTHAEYKCLPAKHIITHKPPNISDEAAAAIPFGGLTALRFLILSGIEEGKSILINGASSAIGTFSIQLAKKYFGAEVTGVCSTSNLAMVKSLGADHVIDYTQEDFIQNSKQYDIVFDVVGTTTFAQAKSTVKPKGVYMHTVMIGGEIKQVWFKLTTGLSVVGGEPKVRQEDLLTLKELVAEGVIEPVIDRVYDFEDIIEAHRYVDTGRKRGAVVIRMPAASD